MPDPFVPAAFDPPRTFDGDGFHLEPLGPQHNERDYDAWTSSIDHIRSTPGFDSPEADWPAPMPLEQNLDDLVRHAADFDDRTGFTYSVLDGDDVIGCLYIYPSNAPEYDAKVTSWVRETRAPMDRDLWEQVTIWLRDAWPFTSPLYAARD